MVVGTVEITNTFHKYEVKCVVSLSTYTLFIAFNLINMAVNIMINVNGVERGCCIILKQNTIAEKLLITVFT